MGRKIAILQSNYIPWKGYFDIINMVDEFILFDHVQYTKRDWRNRNLIKTPGGIRWLTIPVEVKGKFFQSIRDTAISDQKWSERHWKTIANFCSKAPYFQQYADVLEETYRNCRDRYLSDINHRFLVLACSLLGIRTKISWSMDYHLVGDKNECLIELCRQTGAEEYISGPSARGYINESLFSAAGIKVRYVDYSGYPEYQQLYPPFIHTVSIIDLLLNKGAEAPRFMKSF